MEGLMNQLKLIFTGLFLATISSNALAVTLGETFNSALLNNQADNINESRLKQSLELRNRGKGSYFPTLSARGTYLKQEKFDDQKTLGLNLTTTLYNGGRDRELIRNAEFGVDMAKNQRQIDRVNLYMEVVDAYFTYLMNQSDIKNLDLLKKQSQERADEIRKRVQIGRSRRGELLQAEAQLASVDAQTANGIGLLKESESRLFILTGLTREQLHALKFEKSEDPKTLEEYLSMAMGKEDIKNKELEIKQFEGDIGISKAGYLPTLDLLSNYYFVKEGGSNSSRNSDWDVGLNLTIPLYEGGVSSALVRESVEKRQSAEYQLTDYKKSIQIEVTSRYEMFRRYNEQIKAFDLALDRAKRSYEETLRDYRLGLVSNLDVLSSLNLYLTSKRDSERTRIQAVMNQKLLEAVAGILPTA